MCRASLPSCGRCCRVSCFVLHVSSAIVLVSLILFPRRNESRVCTICSGAPASTAAAFSIAAFLDVSSCVTPHLQQGSPAVRCCRSTLAVAVVCRALRGTASDHRDSVSVDGLAEHFRECAKARMVYSAAGAQGCKLRVVCAYQYTCPPLTSPAHVPKGLTHHLHGVPLSTWLHDYPHSRFGVFVSTSSVALCLPYQVVSFAYKQCHVNQGLVELSRHLSPPPRLCSAFR